MMQVARGLAFLYMHGTVVNGFRDEFTFWGAGRILGVPMPILVAAVVVLLTFLLLKYTNFGREIYGIGAKRSVAIYSGLSVPRTTILVYAFSGFIVSLAGLLYIARLDAAEAVIGSSSSCRPSPRPPSEGSPLTAESQRAGDGRRSFNFDGSGQWHESSEHLFPLAGGGHGRRHCHCGCFGSVVVEQSLILVMAK